MIYKKFFNMPIPLKIVVGAGLLVPILSIVSIVTGSILPAQQFSTYLGAAKNIFELLAVFVFTLPIFFGSVMIIYKAKRSKTIYIIGWVMVCISPLLLQSVRLNLDVHFPQLVFNIIVGIGIFTFFYFGKSVKIYFQEN